MRSKRVDVCVVGVDWLTRVSQWARGRDAGPGGHPGSGLVWCCQTTGCLMACVVFSCGQVYRS